MRKLAVRRVLSILLCIIFIFSAAPYSSAESNTNNSLNNSSVSQIVLEYFYQRNMYLRSIDTSFDCVNLAIKNDELAHIAAIENAGLLWSNSTVSITSMSCVEYVAFVDVTETVTFDGALGSFTELVQHSLTLYINESGSPEVVSDAYYEESSDFYSCSFVVSLPTVCANSNSGGSPLCIIAIAQNEVGYVETGTNITKYGEWYGWNGVGWCIIFISWCSVQANVPSSVIPIGAGPASLQHFFVSSSTYFASQAYGGNQVPQAGDIFFLGTNANNPTHGGIVVSVDENNIYVVEGNAGPNSNCVYTRAISRTASNLIGFGRPNYPSTSHSRTAESIDDSTHCITCCNCNYNVISSHLFEIVATPFEHYYYCNICDYQSQGEAHSYIYNEFTRKYTCSICGNITDIIPITPNMMK